MSVMRKVFTSVALAAPMVLAAPMAAHAVDVAVVAGTGTISPGLPCTNCTIDFAFSAVHAGTTATTSVLFTGCTFHGTSSGLEDEAGGAGSGTLSGCGISGTVNYTRVGVVVTVSGCVSVNQPPCTTIGPNALIFLPLSAAPTTSFLVVGAVTF
jgi:hypothetical protein